MLSVAIEKVILSFIVLINPFGALALFLDLTRYYTAKEKRKTAQIASVSVFIVIMVCALIGNWLLRVFGIGVPAFQVSGGILLFLIALSMVNSGANSAKPKIGISEDDEITIHHNRPDIGSIAVVPLAIPMMIGPGSISTVIIYTSSANSYHDLVAVMVSGVVISLFCYICLLAAVKISRFLGNTGLSILNRIMGMLLAAVAVEIVVAGIKGLLPTLLNT